jgi:hypothetical protein
MKTTWSGEQKLICTSNPSLFYAHCEASADAYSTKEWAESVLAAPAVQWQAGDSHEIALRELERVEDVLIDYMRVTAS